MANPRQRRKARSSTHRPVRSTNAKRLRKQPPIKGPKVLQEAWDKGKTVRQNYTALGLLTRLAPGMENDGVWKEQKMDEDRAAARPLPQGKGRIVRDESGNVVGIELAEDAVVEERQEAPDSSPKTDTVRALERLSASGRKMKRQASAHEVKWLSSLVAVYGEDVDAMARDIKRNVWQKTGGELRRAIEKAGGVKHLQNGEDCT